MVPGQYYLWQRVRVLQDTALLILSKLFLDILKLENIISISKNF